MAVMSVFFEPPYNRLACSEILLHKGQTCKQMLWWNWYRCSMGSLRYFLPLAISPLVLRPKSLNKQTLLNIFRHYLESSLWSASGCALTFSAICLLRNVLGRYYLYTATCLPAYLAFQLTWFFPVRTVRLFSTATTQAALETWLRDRNSIVTHSLPIQTLIFMFSSAIILHTKRRKDFNGFWFINPITTGAQQKKSENYEDLKKAGTCIHEGKTCCHFILEGMRKYLLYGVPLDLLSTITKGRPPRSFEELKIIRFNMTKFFLSYVGIYRLSSCVLTRYSNSTYGTPQHLLAAGLGGLSYFFLGKITFSVLALVVATQAAWQFYCNQHNKQPEGRLFAFLKRVPFAKLMIQLNIAYLAHSYVFKHEAMSKLAKGFFRGITDNRFERIYQHLLNLFTEHEKVRF
ncbi:PREDICTED: uncharacterized protein LOC108374737 [Rhagoletis zephyria]|uniref:uncharacterized protein LOC108374737 n=1 Tax=Rhagoletis zephyria TaxID=28612 RepID=UPI0008114AD7|nr:PREDICTED: uncharacterized protein LOC108374737 [Rhagoletis zephyria]XP_017486225.1 PREDICTED: uncharacterized protein LOC108374737 [Rhagoletis zephyria]XP_017486226.1 PREDICTED: uncharacterized protein LOC108374737 [Rhagoletis zephyria]XP_017486227.1 PREDICTED: uncharacterized protein LOC108374737 [Rhagoletis zephyria]XP_017486228.1 PREDICTED: uncharacterized protein LOC108374737 [Rhagoletis zephyria]